MSGMPSEDRVFRFVRMGDDRAGFMLAKPEKGVVLELGGDPYHSAFRPNMNIYPGPSVDIVGDASEGIPLPDNSVGIVFSKFLLEHVRTQRQDAFLRDCYRILSQDGAVVMWVPNAMRLVTSMASNPRWTWAHIHALLGGDPWYPGNQHHMLYNPEIAVALFSNAGFKNVSVWEAPTLPDEMIIEGWK